MKNRQRGQMLVEFLLCFAISVFLWVVLIKVDGQQNIHGKIKDSIRSERAVLEANYPSFSMSRYVAR